MGKVSKLTKSYIDQKACELLNQWAEFSGGEVRPPIPVEAIIEKYLGLTLEYDDLEEMLNIPGVLGATWVDERRVVVNSSLLGGIEGRIAFTCGHEIAHWILHREYFFEMSSRVEQPQPSHLPAIVCRTSASKLRSHRGASTKHLQRYLSEACYRFNRRYLGPQLFHRLLFACTAGTAITRDQLMAPACDIRGELCQ